MPIILEGKTLAMNLKYKLKEQIASFKEKPSVLFVRVGNDPASITYENAKIKDCIEYGIDYNTFYFNENDKVSDAVEALARANRCDGILIFSPLPKGWEIIKDWIPKYCDIDGINYFNNGIFEPCTPAGALKLLDAYGISVEGKHCVVLGRSNTVGKPLADMLLKRNATVTVCHSHTQNLAEITKTADILLSAIGKPKFIKADMIKKGTILVDIGMNRDENGKLCGDIDYVDVYDKAGGITPVPGGCGLITRAILMEHIIMAHTEKEKNYQLTEEFKF